MTMRARSRRILLLSLIVGACVVGGGLYLRRDSVRDADARASREAGMAAFSARDFPLAVQKLSQFIRRLDPDALALLRYAQAIRGLSAPDARHLESAIVSLRRSVAKAPDGAEARQELLDMYRKLGMRPEAIEQANWFLSREPGNEVALKAKASALAEMNQPADALAVLKDRVPPDSARLELHLLYLELMSSLKMPLSEILQRAEDVVAANGSDPRFRLVVARARIAADDMPGAQEILSALVKVGETDKHFARLLVPYLDATGLARQSLQVLVGFDAKDLEPPMQADLVRRLWESRDAQGILTHVTRWKLDPSTLPTAVLGYQVMALGRLKRGAEAGPLLVLLNQRKDDRVAMGWTRLLTGVILAESATVGARISAALTAIEADAKNPHSRFQLGLAYRDAGELELAIRELHAAGTLSPTWGEPAALGMKILAESGQLPAAGSAAEAAELRGSTDPSVLLLATIARTARAGARGGTLSERVLAALIEAGRPARETLPLRLALAVASEKKEAVADLIQEVLRPDQKPEGEVLLACLLLSQKRELGLEALCLARYEALYGNTPGLALTLARQAAFSEGAAAGRTLLHARRLTATDRESSSWSAVEAAYLEAFGSQDDALAAWRETANASRDEPRRLRAILDAASPWKDRDLVRKTIDQLVLATGKSCLWWRYYDARWTLAADRVDAASSDAAINQLRAVIDVAPEHAPARLLLAGAYESRGEPQKALEQLIVARGAGRPTASLDLAIVRMHLKVGDWTAAREVLERLMKEDATTSRRLSPEQRLSIAGMFARLGDPKGVLDLLASLGEKPANFDEVQARAELYASAGELDVAERMIGPVADKNDPQALLLAAALADYQGRSREAESFLTRLGEVTPDPLVRERMRADHFLRVQNLARAEESLRKVVAIESAEGSDWSRLLAFQMLQGKPGTVAETLKDGRSRGWFSNRDRNDDLSAEVLGIAAVQPDLRSLGAAYVRDAAQRSAAEQGIRFLDAASRSEPSATEATQLRTLAERNPKFLELQLALADFLFRRRAFEDAVIVCRTAADAFPGASEPIRALAYCYRALGRADRAAEAAKEWRSRSKGLTLGADLFLAEQSTPAEVIGLLGPHVERAIDRGVPGVLILYGQAMILQRRADEVSDLFAPKLGRGDAVIQAWVALAGFAALRGDAPRAFAWLDRDEVRAAAARQPDVRLELATAWQLIAKASGNSEAQARSLEYLKSLPLDANLQAKAWERIGQLYEAQADAGSAEAAYRKALSVDPHVLIAVNNLAMILARSDRAAEAKPMVDELVLRRPELAEYGDTRAFVYLQLGDRATALQQYEECRRLDGKNVTWAIRILEVMVEQADRQGAEKRFRSFRDEYPLEGMSAEQRGLWSELARKLGQTLKPGK